MQVQAGRVFRVLLIGLILAGVVALVLVGSEAGWLARVTDQKALRGMVEGWGVFGPVLIILLLAMAIVMSPLPSAPIAMVAGAAYGPVWGTMLTVAGACLGASIAFSLARFLAYDAVRRWDLVDRQLTWLERGHSQNWLMGAIFLTRLAPFLSFDAISYAAGLTPLAFWRFALATLLGVTPISFLLAYGGDTALAIGSENPIITLLIFGGITGIPILARMIWVTVRGRER